VSPPQSGARLDTSILRLADAAGWGDTLQNYALGLSRVRSACGVPLPHYRHLSLYVSARGISTGSIAVDGRLIELSLDLAHHQVALESSSGATWSRPLGGDTQQQFCAALVNLGVEPSINSAAYADQTPPSYDRGLVRAYHAAAIGVDTALAELAVTHPRSARLPTAHFGDRELWAHHFDLAMLWFSGWLVPEQDHADADSVDE